MDPRTSHRHWRSLAILSLFVAISPAYPQVAPATKPAGNGTIDGIVVDDQGKPVPAAEVRLLRSSLYASSAPLFTPFTTGPDGTFHFEDLVPGRYTFPVEHARFKMDFSEVPRVDLRLGEHLTGMRLVVFTAAVISGTVIDEYGDPIQAAVVEVLQYTTTGNRRQLVVKQTARTDDRGVYRISDVRPAPSYVRTTFAARPGTDGSRYLPVYFPDAPDRAHAKAIEVSGGSEYKAINLVMRQGKTYTVRGRLQTKGSEKPKEISGVQLLYADTEEAQKHSFAAANGGIFEFPNVVPGDYLLEVGAGFVIYSASEGPPACVQRGHSRITVTDSDLDLVIETACGGTLTGTATLEDGTPVQARINFTSSEPSESPNPALADPAGHFQINHFAPGRYFLTTTTLDKWTYLKTIDGKPADPSDPPIVSSDIGAASNLQIVLSTHTAKITGTLKTGAAGVVAIWPADAKIWNPDYVRTARANAIGRYLIEGIAPGRYFVAAWEAQAVPSDGILGVQEFLHPFQSPDGSIVLAEDAASTIDLQPNSVASAAAAIGKLR